MPPKLAKVVLLITITCFVANTNAQSVTFRTSKDFVVPLGKWEVRKSPAVSWTKFNPDSIKYLKGYNEFRTEVSIEDELDEFKFLVLRLYGPLSSYQVFWDDSLILLNGKVSMKEGNETPGQLLQTVKLPRSSTQPGIHAIRLISSNWGNSLVHPFLNNDFGLRFTYIGYGHVLVASESRAILSITLGAGVLVLTALFSLVLYYSGNTYKSYILLSTFCLLNVAVLLIQFAELYFPVNMAYFTELSSVLILLIALKGAYLCYFFVHHFRLGWNKSSFAVLLLISITGALLSTNFNFFLMTGIAICYAAFASYWKKIGSVSSFIGLVGMMVVYIITSRFPLTPGYAYGSIFFAYAMIFSIGRQIKETNKAKHKLELKSAQLEMAMIKKSIQPHFLMNTLLSIISWLEAQPKIAVQIIQALAREFRMINDISSKGEITIKEEIELCENHLQIMSLRKGTKYSLIKKDLPQNFRIPPMIFHTLLENGLTHAFQAGEEGIFWLSYNSTENFDHFTLKNNGSQLKLNGHSQEGMGITFVRSQLKIRYGNRWDLSAGLIDDQWVVDIKLYKS